MPRHNKVFVTGADGFIGSHLVEHLLSKEYDVTALCVYNSNNSWGWLDRYAHDRPSNLKILLGDIRDAAFIQRESEDMDAILHLAALISIPYSYSAAQSYIDTNITGTNNVLQASVANNVERVLVTSTSEVYGTAIEVPMPESHKRQPQSPYSATKIAADCLSEAYYRSFGLPVTLVRPFNTYGPRQSARAFIPSVVSQVLTSKVLEVGDLSPRRDLVFVQETAAAFEKIMLCDSLSGEDCNVCTGTDYAMSDVLEVVLDLVGKDVEVRVDESRIRPEKSEVRRLLGDNTKLKEHVGWVPSVSLEDGLAKTVDWISDNIGKFRPSFYHK